jgi:hypothetical protein
MLRPAASNSLAVDFSVLILLTKRLLHASGSEFFKVLSSHCCAARFLTPRFLRLSTGQQRFWFFSFFIFGAGACALFCSRSILTLSRLIAEEFYGIIISHNLFNSARLLGHGAAPRAQTFYYSAQVIISGIAVPTELLLTF